MTQNLSAQALLIIIAPPNLEEILVDLLLLQKSITGFTSCKVHGHGTRPGAGKTELSMVDQCFSLDKNTDTGSVYHQFHQTLSELFTQHDQAFDDPFIDSTKS